MKAKALAVKAALGTAFAAAIVLAPHADAATVKTTTAACASGTFKGNVSLSYETTGGEHHPISATMASGPYIGDYNQLKLDIYYFKDGVKVTVHTRRLGGTIPAKVTWPVPDSVEIPATAESYASATFTSGIGGSPLCAARAEIK
jgi:hypothetical protein